MKGIEVYVSGVVQGVGFRYFAKKMAKELGIRGFVKNLPDGRVYVYAVGDAATLDKFISALHRGPPLAVVRELDVKEVKVEELDDFEVRY